MTYILVIWTIIAATGGAQYSDYRPVGEFVTENACKVAGEQLKLSKDRPFVCLKKI